MPAGSPRIPGMSKTTKPITSMNAPAARIDGQSNGRTTLQITLRGLAPLARAASSSAGSMLRKAGDTMR